VRGVEEWWLAGERVPVGLRGIERMIWMRRVGSGTCMTLLHGYPSSSHDWAKVLPALADRHALLLFDFLGFGASDKPADHTYSIHEQADLVEAIWRRERITETTVVAHDYAVSVVQELLARRAEGGLSVSLSSVHLLNGGLYPDLHRPVPIQNALLDPEQGPILSARLTEEEFAAAAGPTFGEDFDAASDIADIWRANSRGSVVMHRTIRYMVDRREHERRWVEALEHTDVPMQFSWGMLDPISGAHIAERIRDRLPGAPFLALEDVGHWPQLEAPNRVASALVTEDD
jgi:pimeloyl-ACP methyl ester carboxylesterase